MALSAVGAVKDRKEYQTFYNGMGDWRWGGFGGSTTTTVENQRIGTLVLDMYDAARRQLIWRGVATHTLSTNPEKNRDKLQKAVSKMLKHFPPKESKKA